MIEDDCRLAAMVKTYLAQHGYVVAHAPTGEEGLAALRDHERAGFAAVLLDLMLPTATGSTSAGMSVHCRRPQARCRS